MVRLPKRTETSLITEADLITESDQAMRAVHGCNGWFTDLFAQRLWFWLRKSDFITNYFGSNFVKVSDTLVLVLLCCLCAVCYLLSIIDILFVMLKLTLT